MIIKEIRTKKIDLSLRKPFIFALGEIKELNYGLLELFAEDKEGEIRRGIGEFACPWIITGETQAGFIEVIDKFFKPILIGMEINSIDDIRVLVKEMEKVIPFNPSSKAAVEMAVFDLLGKIEGSPINLLLGNKVKDEVKLTYVLTMSNDVKSCFEEAKRAIQQGFNCLKLKVGNDDQSDLEKIKLINQLVDKNIIFSLDVNEGWKTVEKSLEMIDKIKDYSIAWIEDPVRNSSELAKITEKSPLKIMADASLWGPEDAKIIIAQKACHLFNIKLHEAGGILRAKEILDLAENNNIKCIIGSCIETDIGTAASVHLASLSENIITTELVGVYEITDKITSGLELVSGGIKVPPGSGLGVRLL